MMVCSECFNDLELKKFIEANSSETGDCDSCSCPETKIIEIAELLDFFSEFLEIFQEDDLGLPLVNIIQKDWQLFSDSAIASKILTDVFSINNPEIDTPNSRVSYLVEINECISYWDILKDELKWESRFLTDIDNIIELGWDSFFNDQLLLKEDEVFYRTRIHKEDGQECYPKDEMGSPSKENANSGRANPQGIPYLYLSREIETTFYETRVTYLDEISVGSFKVAGDNEIVLVDFTDNGSVFLNMGNIIEFTKGRILKKFISEDLSLPIRRYDSELEYIPTQFICEFIRYVTGANGILFESSLNIGGSNIVLFDEEQVECFEVGKYRINSVKITGISEEDDVIDFDEEYG